MKYALGVSFLFSVLSVLGGCGGGGASTGQASGGAVDPGDPLTPGLNAAQNWQFTTASTKGFPAIAIAGGIDQTTSPVQAIVHINGSSCFDHLSAVQLTGASSDGSLSLTSSPVAGQVIAYAGTTTGTPAEFTGTYSIHGGCADGDQGSITGGVEPTSMKGSWAGDFTSETGSINRIS